MRVSRHPFWISVVFFLMVAAPGFWLPVLSNVLAERGWESVTVWAFLIPPLASIISPLLFASLADNRFPADRVLMTIIGGGGFFLFAAFWALEHFETPWPFLGLFLLTFLVSAPSFSLLTSVTFHHLDGGRESQFGNYRVWGTLGWIFAGVMVSVLGLDQSAKVGQIAAGIRIVAAICCLFLPHTPPTKRGFTSIGDALGLGSFKLLKERDMGVYFLTTFLFSIPLAAYYLHTPRHLEALGWERVGAGMSLGQITEVFLLFAMAAIMGKWRIKTIFLVAIGCGILRYIFNIYAGYTESSSWLIGGILLHGICWTLFFESGRIFVDRRVTDMRSQAQALLTFAQNGLGSMVGIFVVDQIYRQTVLRGVENAWSIYWGILTAMCVFCGVLFLLGYRGSSSPSEAISRVK